jgi:hypothetical protein
MLWSAITLAYFGLLRASELCVTSTSFDPKTNLNLTDVKVYNPGQPSAYMSVHVKQSKTDTGGKGVHVFIGCSGQPVCAVCAMVHYLGLCKIRQFNQPLFSFQNGHVLTKPLLLSYLRSFLNALGVDPSKYSGHSFRSGGATDAALSGMGDWEIKLAGRWTSDAYQRYVRAPPSLLAGFARRMLYRQPGFHLGFNCNVFQ